MLTVAAIAAGFLLDALLGDPRRIPHPVVAMGRAISWLEPRLRSAFPDSPAGKRGAGAVLALVLCAGSFGIAWAVIALAGAIHPLLGFAVEAWLCYQALAACELRRQSMRVVRELACGGLPAARKAVGMIVGRDTAVLDEPGVLKAAVETVAENTVDGIIAPLFFLLLGGAPLAMAYKAVNTLDSMVGYKHEKYRAIGMVSARLDDVANFLPARLSWLLLSLAAVLCREDGARALRTGWRDRYQHSSPNCAWPEATVAGALGIRLGGPNDYFGQRVEKPWIGDAVRDIAVDDISRTIRLMWVASSLALALFIGVRYWLVGAA